MAGKVVILVEQVYEDLEFWYPYYRMKEAGYEVVAVGPVAGKIYPSKHGLEAQADTDPSGIDASTIDALIIPGGFAPDHMRRVPQMVDLVRNAYQAGKVVAAICHGGWMLASAGIARGKKLTCFFAIKDDLVNAGAEYQDKEVVQDGNLITSRMPSDLPAFCRTILAALQK